MMITEFLAPELIVPRLKGTDKESVIREIGSTLSKAGHVNDLEKTVKVLLDREQLGSTGIGQNIAVPHAKSEEVKKLVVAAGLSETGVNFDALDGDPVHIFFLVLAPVDSTGLHLKVLARIARLLKDKMFRNALRGCKTADELYQTIKEEDERMV